MRRIAVGLAAAVIAAGVGVAGVAQAGALSAVVFTDSTDYVQVGNIQWSVVGTTCAGTNVSCGNLAITANAAGNGIMFSGYSGGSLVSINSVSTFSPPTVTDFSVTINEFATTGAFGAATISSVGGTLADTAIVENSSGAINGGNASLSTIWNQQGTVTNGPYPATITFAPTNDVLYVMDNQVSSGLVSVSVGQPVPEPASLPLLAGALAMAAVVRSRRQRRAA